MDRHPVKPVRRYIYEIAIRVLDILVYTVVLAGGIYALVAPPDTVINALEGWEWLATAWGVLLAAGGLIGLCGRFAGYWLIETPATIASATGILIYTVILAEYTFTSVTAVVATSLVLVAFAFMVRRWMELQLFSTESGASWRKRFHEAWTRRTDNTVYRVNP